ncbi:restriction endonuclease subunit S, partial [candidate division TA06 bacterium]
MSEKIPKGWKKYKFTDIAEIIGGGTPSKNNLDYWNGNIDWLTVSDFNTEKKYVRSAEQKITQLGLKKSSTKILKKGQIIISARGTVGI